MPRAFKLFSCLHKFIHPGMHNRYTTCHITWSSRFVSTSLFLNSVLFSPKIQPAASSSPSQRDVAIENTVVRRCPVMVMRNNRLDVYCVSVKTSSHSSAQTCRATMMHAYLFRIRGKADPQLRVCPLFWGFTIRTGVTGTPPPPKKGESLNSSRLRAEIGGRLDDDGSDLARLSSRINISCRCSTPRRWQRLLKTGVISSWRRPGDN